MRDIDFIRYLIDLLDTKNQSQGQTIEIEAEPEAKQMEEPEEHESGTNPMDRDDIFVPPLQAKLEMMKKMTGVPTKDETLKQSQEQGGPSGAKPAETSMKSLIQTIVGDVEQDDLVGD